MNPKRLVFLIVSLSYAGAQTQMLALAKTLQARGWDIKVVTMMKPEGSTIVPMLEALDIPWASLDVTRGSSNPLEPILKLRKILKKWQPTILHSHMIHANILARLARLVASIPILICTAHNTVEGGPIREIMYRLTDPLCDTTTNVSQVAVERYIKMGIAPRNKISLLPNGIDSTRFKSNPEARVKVRETLGLENDFSWLAVGRLDDQKDFTSMIKAFSMLKNTKSRLLIVGEGPHLEVLQTLLKELKLESRVKLLGVRQDVPELMNAVDGYVMSSVMEGLPMVLLEAAASGLPIVSTDVGGNREVVLEGQNGFLVPHSQPQALAEAMQKLMDLPSVQQQSMGQKGREHVSKTYDLEGIVDQWEALYAKWIKAKKTPIA
jgi:glycosyltransferase involved in cell wall biosynthesis